MKKTNGEIDQIRRKLHKKEIIYLISAMLISHILAGIIIFIGACTLPPGKLLNYYPNFLIYPFFPLCIAAAIFLRKRYGTEFPPYEQMSTQERRHNFLFGALVAWTFASSLMFRIFIDFIKYGT